MRPSSGASATGCVRSSSRPRRRSSSTCSCQIIQPAARPQRARSKSSCPTPCSRSSAPPAPAAAGGPGAPAAAADAYRDDEAAGDFRRFTERGLSTARSSAGRRRVAGGRWVRPRGPRAAGGPGRGGARRACCPGMAAGTDRHSLPGPRGPSRDRVPEGKDAEAAAESDDEAGRRWSLTSTSGWASCRSPWLEQHQN